MDKRALIGLVLSLLFAYTLADSPSPTKNFNENHDQLNRHKVHQGQVHQSQVHQPQVHQAQAHQAQVHQAQIHQAQVHQAPVHQGQVHQGQVHQGQVHQVQVNHAQVHHTQKASLNPLLEPQGGMAKQPTHVLPQPSTRAGVTKQPFQAHHQPSGHGPAVQLNVHVQPVLSHSTPIGQPSVAGHSVAVEPAPSPIFAGTIRSTAKSHRTGTSAQVTNHMKTLQYTGVGSQPVANPAPTHQVNAVHEAPSHQPVMWQSQDVHQYAGAAVQQPMAGYQAPAQQQMATQPSPVQQPIAPQPEQHKTATGHHPSVSIYVGHTRPATKKHRTGTSGQVGNRQQKNLNTHQQAAAPSAHPSMPAKQSSVHSAPVQQPMAAQPEPVFQPMAVHDAPTSEKTTTNLLSAHNGAPASHPSASLYSGPARAMLGKHKTGTSGQVGNTHQKTAAPSAHHFIPAQETSAHPAPVVQPITAHHVAALQPVTAQPPQVEEPMVAHPSPVSQPRVPHPAPVSQPLAAHHAPSQQPMAAHAAKSPSQSVPVAPTPPSIYIGSARNLLNKHQTGTSAQQKNDPGTRTQTGHEEADRHAQQTRKPAQQTVEHQAPASSLTKHNNAHTQSQVAAHQYWSTWGEWSACSTTCGDGFHIRMRQCKTVQGHDQGGYTNGCTGSSSERQNCIAKCCPVDGGWSYWTHWSNHGGPKTKIQKRTRGCRRPYPSCGGQFCLGDPSEIRTLHTLLSSKERGNQMN